MRERRRTIGDADEATEVALTALQAALVERDDALAEVADLRGKFAAAADELLGEDEAE